MTSELSATNWGGAVAAAAQNATTYSIGLTSGSRFANDRRSVERLVRCASAELMNATGASTLLLRLDPMAPMGPAPTTKTSAPVATKSPLGPWYELNLPVPEKNSTAWALEHIPHWLPQWKLRHRLVAVDLGPMHLAPSRIIGRLCDTCYVLLGPATCASHDWIMQQIDFHSRAGSVIAGSIVTTAVSAAAA